MALAEGRRHSLPPDPAIARNWSDARMRIEFRPIDPDFPLGSIALAMAVRMSTSGWGRDVTVGRGYISFDVRTTDPPEFRQYLTQPNALYGGGELDPDPWAQGEPGQ